MKTWQNGDYVETRKKKIRFEKGFHLIQLGCIMYRYVFTVTLTTSISFPGSLSCIHFTHDYSFWVWSSEWWWENVPSIHLCRSYTVTWATVYKRVSNLELTTQYTETIRRDILWRKVGFWTSWAVSHELWELLRSSHDVFCSLRLSTCSCHWPYPSHQPRLAFQEN